MFFSITNKFLSSILKLLNRENVDINSRNNEPLFCSLNTLSNYITISTFCLFSQSLHVILQLHSDSFLRGIKVASLIFKTTLRDGLLVRSIIIIISYFYFLNSGRVALILRECSFIVILDFTYYGGN